jgi:hypothetical protein
MYTKIPWVTGDLPSDAAQDGRESRPNQTGFFDLPELSV